MNDSARSGSTPIWQVPPLFGVLLICLTVIVVYGQVYNFDFVNYDDHLYVLTPDLRDGLTMHSVAWAFTDATQYSIYWSPVLWLSVLLDHQLFGYFAGGYHLTNVLLHLANCLLLYAFLYRVSGALWKSTMVALLFAAHPLHVESVAWVAERKEVLCGLFWMLSLNAYLHYCRHPGVWRYLLLAVCFLGGLLAKPMIVTLPVALLLLDYWPLQRVAGAPPDSAALPAYPFRFLVAEKLPLLGVALTYSLATIRAQMAVQGTSTTLAAVPVSLRIANAATGYVTYLAKALLPIHLGVLYPYRSDIPLWQTLAALALLTMLLGLTVVNRRRHPQLLVGALWFLLVMLPVSGLVIIGPHCVADRYSYITFIGLYVATVWSLAKLAARSNLLRIGVNMAAAVALCSLVFLARAQVAVWQDSITLFTHGLQVEPNNSVLHNNLGNAYKNAGDLDKAQHHYRTAILQNPTFALAYNNLGATLIAEGRPREAEPYLRAALKIDPGQRLALINVGRLLLAENHPDEVITLIDRSPVRLDEVLQELRRRAATAVARQGG